MMYDAWYLTPRVTDDVDVSFISVWKRKKNSSVRRLDFVLKTKLCLGTRSWKIALSLVIVNILMLDWYTTETLFEFDAFNNFCWMQFNSSTIINRLDLTSIHKSGSIFTNNYVLTEVGRYLISANEECILYIYIYIRYIK